MCAQHLSRHQRWEVTQRQAGPFAGTALKIVVFCEFLPFLGLEKAGPTEQTQQATTFVQLQLVHREASFRPRLPTLSAGPLRGWRWWSCCWKHWLVSCRFFYSQMVSTNNLSTRIARVPSCLRRCGEATPTTKVSTCFAHEERGAHALSPLVATAIELWMLALGQLFPTSSLSQIRKKAAQWPTNLFSGTIGTWSNAGAFLSFSLLDALVAASLAMTSFQAASTSGQCIWPDTAALLSF